MKDLKDYIVILNNRNIQRQRESGFTLYAVLAAIIYCFFYLIDNLSTLVKIKNDVNYLNITVIASNSFIILYLLYAAYGIATRKKELTKIFPYREPLKIELEDFPYFLFLAICSFLNFIFIVHSQNTIHEIYLIIFGILTGLNFISPFIIDFYRKNNERKKIKKGHSIEKIGFTFFNKKVTQFFSYLYFIYAIILSIFSCIVFLKIKLNESPKALSEIIKYVSILFGSLFLIKTVIDLKSKENKNNQLEDFEKEMFFNDLKDEDIVKKFEQDFSGIPFSKWIIKKQIEIKNFFDTKKQEFLRADSLINDIDKIDRANLQYEFRGRLNDIIKEQVRLLNETNDFVQRIGTNFRNLKSFGSLDNQEFEQLNYVQTFLSNNINAFNNFYNNLSNQIKDRH